VYSTRFPSVGRGYLDHGFVGFHLHHVLILGDVITFPDHDPNDLRFRNSLSEIG